MTITLNLDGVEAWTGGGVLLPVGRHVCKIAAAEQNKSFNDHPQIRLVWEAVAGDCVGGTIRERLTKTDATGGKIRAFLDAIGYPIPHGNFELDVADLVGRRATITIALKPSRDDPSKSFSEVVAHEPAPGATAAQPAASMVRDTAIPF